MTVTKSTGLLPAKENSGMTYNLLMQAPVAIVVFKGADYIIELVNDRYLTLAGKSREELLNKPAFEAMPVAATQGFIELLDKIRITGKAVELKEHETLIERNGRLDTTWLNIVYKPLQEAEQTADRIMIFTTDVTEEVLLRRRVEQSEAMIRHTNDQLELSITAGHVGLWYWDVQKDLLSWSREQEQLFGVKEGYACKRIADFRSFVHPDDLERIDGYLAPVPDAKSSDEYQFRIIRTDGSERWIEARSKTLFDTSGKAKTITGINIDITEQVDASIQLKAVQEQLALTFKNVPSAIYHFNKSGKIIYVNQLGAEMMGYSSVEDILRENDVFNLRKKLDQTYLVLDEAGEALDVEKSSAALTFKTGKPAEVISQFVNRLTGKSFWLLSKSSPLFDEKGNLLLVLSTATDISIHKTSEQAIRMKEQQLELMFQNVPADIFLFDRTGKMVFANDRAAQFMGYENAKSMAAETVEAIRSRGRELFEVFDENGNPHTKESTPLYYALKNGRSAEGVYSVHYKKDNQVRWRYNTATPLLNDKEEVDMVLVSTIDITAQKETEAIIRESSEKFRTLAETIPQLIWMTNEKGEQEYASSRWKEYSGIEPAGWESWQQIVHPADISRISDAWSASRKAGKLYKAEVRLKSKDGEYRWHSVQGEPVRNESGIITKWIGAFSDIHDQKAVAAKLEKIVAERTKELQRSNEDLQQFAHVASHDLKEPVRKVKTFGSRLAEEFGHLLPEKGKLYVNKMESAAARMYSMIDGVLLYSSVNALEQPVEKINLNEVFNNIRSDLEITMHQKRAIIDSHTLPVIEGFPVLIYQLFYNLVNNSIKFCCVDIPPVINVSSFPVEEKDVKHLKLLQTEKYIRVTVTDNGIGFSESESDKIFRTFYRLNSKDKFEGTGLGLSLCKKIVERHAGKITAESEEGKGATFHIYLPMKFKYTLNT